MMLWSLHHFLLAPAWLLTIKANHDAAPKKTARCADDESMEAWVGIEPAYADLQSAA